MPDPLSTASSLTIRELSGSRRTLEFQGRALPDRSGSFKLDGSVRQTTDWYAGNPRATQQVFGPKEEPSTLTGTWKDRFIRPTDLNGAPVTPEGIATVNGVQVESVVALVKLVDDFRRQCQLVEVSWDAFARQGLMTRFTATPIRGNTDWQWEMQFEWQSQSDPDVPAGFSLPVDQADTYSQLVQLRDGLSAAAVPPAVALDGGFRSSFVTALSDADAQIGGIGDNASSVADAAVDPITAARRTISHLSAVQADAQDVIDSVDGMTVRSILGLPGGVMDMPLGLALRAELYAANVRASARDLEFMAAGRAALASQQAVQDQSLLATVVAVEGQDLRQLSVQFYGVQDEWGRLADYNGLVGSRLSAGTVVLVPKLQRLSAAVGS